NCFNHSSVLQSYSCVDLPQISTSIRFDSPRRQLLGTLKVRGRTGRPRPPPTPMTPPPTLKRR
ncbi:hypothetical protein CY34DRAFT_751895, partial [Suillus luteus UH-Slu-Lm8-n1]